MSGSDLMWSEQIERLKEAGARVYVGHNAAQMIAQGAPPPDALVVSSAVGRCSFCAQCANVNLRHIPLRCFSFERSSFASLS